MSIDLGVLLLRVLVGAAIAAHGSQKLFGAFGGYGLKGTGAVFETLGFRPGAFFAAMAGGSELIGGGLLVLGLLTPVGAALVLATMIVAIVTVHFKNGFFAATNGIELPFLYAAVALAIIFIGGGAYSLDTWLGFRFLAEPAVVGGGVAFALIGAVLNLAVRRREPMKTVAT
jgi:putative oxidoreductase